MMPEWLLVSLRNKVTVYSLFPSKFDAYMDWNCDSPKYFPFLEQDDGFYYANLNSGLLNYLHIKLEIQKSKVDGGT